ncbi:MAG: single-stranded DNA-binding protein [Sulfurimonas sp.]|nr:single-stranded DNA-binding protein [Sulfurimonas sp.]
MFNKIILLGNLTRDIELKYSQGGMAIASTAIATSRKFKVNGEQREEVCFVDITFFGRSAEVANQYLRKGSKILVEGRLKLDQWTDQNGQKRSKHGVVVETMKMLDSRDDTQPPNSYAPTHDGSSLKNNNNNSRYDEPQQQSQQPMGYDGKPYQAPQQPTYEHQDKNGNQVSQESYQANQQVQKQMPKPDDIPVIDVDEDEIPF